MYVCAVGSRCICGQDTVRLIKQRRSEFNAYASLCYSRVKEAFKANSQLAFLPLRRAGRAKIGLEGYNLYGAGASQTISMESVEALR